MRHPKLVVIALAWVVSIAWTASAQTFSLSGDWSNTTNPDGPWSYDQGTVPLPLVPDWTANGSALVGCNQPAWAPSNNGRNFLPALMQANACSANFFGTDPNNGLANVMLGDVVVHTVDSYNGNLSKGVANFSFTLPAGEDSNYEISGFVWDAGLFFCNSRPQDWRLLVNGVQKASGYLNGCVSRSEAETFDVFIPLSAGDTVDLQLYEDPTSPFGFFVGTNMTISARPATQLVPVTPCRVVDTRTANGGFGGPPIQGGTARSFPIPQGACNIPPTAAAYSLNVTVVPHGPLGYLTVWPTGGNQPNVSTLNSLDGRVKANAAIVPAGYQGAVSVYVTNTTDVILDIDAYFMPPGNSAMAFYPLTPCRVADTRFPNDQGLGAPYLSGGVQRDFPILNSSCGIPNTAQAYSFNFTAVPHVSLGYLTVWPAGGQQPVVSTLNGPTGTTTANAGIVPAGAGGDIDVFASNDSDLVIDVNGYFAAPGQGGLSLYLVAPCRVLDTRGGNGAFVGELTVDVVDSVCAPPSTAKAYVFNATVVPSGPLGYLTLWPDGGTQPLVSTLNAIDGTITANMAIVPTNNGSIEAYASNLTQLILDISSYFAP